MSLLEVQHQPHAMRQLQRAIGGGRIPHAYIFHGPDGVGKELTATGFSQRLLCAAPATKRLTPAEASDFGVDAISVGCGNCDDCRMAQAGMHPDLHLISRQLHRDHPDPDVRKRKGLELGVDVVRHFLIDRVSLTAFRGRAKVFIVREADGMNVQAQNALLKTLEEPPKDTFILLLVRSLDRLLATTQSRCHVIEFGRLPADLVQAKLAAFRPSLPREKLEWCAGSAEGSIGRAIEFADRDAHAAYGRIADSMSRLPKLRDEAAAKLWQDEAKVLGEKLREQDADITEAESTRRGLAQVLQLAAQWHQDALHELCIRGADADEVERVAAAIDNLAAAEGQLDSNANAQLIVEVLIGDLKGLHLGARAKS